MLRQVVVEGAESRQVLRHEPRSELTEYRPETLLFA